MRVDGIFEIEHHQGRYTFYNEIQATKVTPVLGSPQVGWWTTKLVSLQGGVIVLSDWGLLLWAAFWQKCEASLPLAALGNNASRYLARC